MEDYMQATIFDIQRASMVDGPGIRTAVFFKGCNLRCAWCHNPEGMDKERQLLFYGSRCTHCGRCREYCVREECISCGECEAVCLSGARKAAGRSISTEELIRIAREDKPFYRREGGITCSGGECMLQVDFLEEFLAMCRSEGIHTAVDTAGCVPWTSFERVLPHADLFLYDVKCISEVRHREFVGADNRVIMENYRMLIESGARVWVRIPLIPGFNCDDEEMGLIRDFLRRYRPERIEILPYHTMGEGKYEALGKNCQTFSTPPDETVQKYRNWMK